MATVCRAAITSLANTRKMPPKFIKKREVAQLFGVSKSTIDRWLLAGKLPKPRKRFGSRRWDYDKLAALLKSKRN
jgi:excisionase family DNA binding protein